MLENLVLGNRSAAIDLSLPPMATQESVINGWPAWTDYSVNRTQWTLTDDWATGLKALLSVFLALSTTYLLKIILSTFTKFMIWKEGSPPAENSRDDEIAGETSSLLRSDSHGYEGVRRMPSSYENGQTPSSSRLNGLMVSHTATGGRSYARNLTKHNLTKGAEHKTFLTIFGVVILSIFIAWAIASVFSAKVATDRAALWYSKHCGIWKFNSSAGGVDAATRHDIYDRQKESRAGEYAQNCYGSANLLKSESCNFFYRPTIPYASNPTWDCPFASNKMCVQGQQAIEFRTGLIDPNDIGVNSKQMYKFRRNTTCAPLTWDDSFVRNETNDGKTTYYYQFGSKGNGYNYTYSTTGNPHDWHAPNYLLRTYATSLFPEEDDWQPISELKPPTDSTLTIMFISALRIFYPKPNRDPIFPADHPFGGGDDPWYWKSDPKARTLACIDSSEMCTHDGARCWSMHDQSTEITFSPEYWFMKLSLENSNIYDSIKTRLGDALVAQRRVSQYQSQDLGDRHWMIEAERLFQTSLARIQYDAWAIGSGEDQARVRDDGYSLDTPEEAGNLCGIFKFRSSEYTNLLRDWFIGLLFILPGFWVLSSNVSTIGDRYHWTIEHYRSCCMKRERDSQDTGPGAAAEHAEVLQNETTEQTTPTDASEVKWEPLVIHWMLKFILWDLWVYLVKGIISIPPKCSSSWESLRGFIHMHLIEQKRDRVAGRVV